MLANRGLIRKREIQPSRTLLNARGNERARLPKCQKKYYGSRTKQLEPVRNASRGYILLVKKNRASSGRAERVFFREVAKSTAGIKRATTLEGKIQWVMAKKPPRF